ncbi:rab effector MyRIP-like isoform X1 [Osmerus eperlanus]|uniref:rab effector MyRIP-like isoform X1 n=1 Tax=Osmerus eperlanus TaxID=29151 RepID=UPI002E0FF8BB
MGRKLDLSGLTQEEAEHVLQVVQRDMRLRKKEEERLSEMKLELDEEGSRCSLLSRQRHFNERCCIRCSSPFSFLLNPKRSCRDCGYNVCKACRAYSKKDKAWLCSVCQKTRLLKTRSLEWYYNNVKCRFKRFGSAKVLKTLYRKHLAEHGTLAELTEGSTYEESIGNDDSICGSDSTFYRQSEEHSMAETLTVAMRVAEEAIDEAISKAEFHTDNQAKQNEAHYLQLHRQELIEELAKTIVQNVIRRRRNLSEGKPELDWRSDQSSEQCAACPASHSSQPPSGQPPSGQPPSGQPPSSQPPSGQPHSALKVFRSHSAFSLLDTSPGELPPGLDPSQGLKKEGGGAAITNWKSVDRLDNSMLKSPDGNWMALQSTQLSRPSLLTKRKSLVYSVLERESGVVSAYDEMGSDTEAEGAWGAALLEIRRKMNSGALLLSDSEEGKNSKSQKSMLSLLKRKVPIEHRRTGTASPRRRSVIDMNFNPEGPESSGADELEVNKGRRLRKKKRTKKDQASLSSSVPEYSTRLLEALVKKHAGKKESQSSYVSDAVTPDTLTSDGLTSGALTPDPFDPEVGLTENTDGSAAKAATMNEELNVKLRQLAGRVRGNQPTEHWLDEGRENKQERHGVQQEVEDGRFRDTDVDMERGQMDEVMEERRGGREGEKEEMMFNLCRLAAQSSVTQFSSTEDELDRVGRSEGDWEEERDEEMTEEPEGERGGHADQLTYKLRELARQVRANQFSSTEDELDRLGLNEEDMERGGEEGSEREWDGEKEEMRSKLYRLAKQVDASQCSSTEDESDRAGPESEGEEGGEGGGGESEKLLEEGSLWEMEAEKKELASKVRDLASLVSASQFSSTEDELDRMGEEEKEQERKDRERLWFMGVNMEEERGRGKREERRDSIGKLDVGLFDFDDGDKVEDGERAMDSEVGGDQKDTRRGYTPVEREQEMRGDLAARREKQEETHESDETDESSTQKGESLPRAEHGHTDEGRASMKGAPATEREERQAGETGDPSEERPELRRTVSEEGVMEFDRIISSITLALDEVEGERDPYAEWERERHEDTEGRTGEGEAEEDDGNKVGRETESSRVSVEETHEMAVWSEGQRDTVDLSGQNVMDGENVLGKKEHDSKEKERMEHESTQSTAEQQNTEKRIKDISAMAEKDTCQETEDDKTYRVVFKRVEVVEEEREEKQDKEKEDMTAEGSDINLAKREEEEALGESDNKNKCKNTEEREEDVEDNRPTELQDSAPSVQGDLLSPEEIQNRYSAVSLRSITTEVLKVLNATEELLQGMKGSDLASGDHQPPAAPRLPPNTDIKKLDEQLGRMEENVYVAAGTVYGLEAELGDLEECARGVSAATSENELAFLEDQVASAAAQVQQSELQVSDIAARIAALKNAGLDVIPQTRFVKPKTQPQTLDSSRQFRRRLPAPPLKDKET